MPRIKGAISTPLNYEVGLTGPFDARMVVPTKMDLTQSDNWTISGTTVPNVYNGMIVAVGADVTSENNGIYYLVDSKNFNSEDSWIKLAEFSEILQLTERVKTLEKNQNISSGITEEQLNTAIDNLRKEILDSGFLTKADLEFYVTLEQVQKMIPDVSNFITSEEVNTLISSATSGLATEQFVTDKIASAQLGGDVDLSNYVTQQELTTAMDTIDYPTVIVQTKKDLPSVGDENHVYITVEERDEYIWSNTAQDYLPINQSMSDVEIIYGGNAE